MKRSINKGKMWWFACGTTLGLTSLSIALGSVPTRHRVTDDTAIYQNLSEIRVAKEKDLNFDQDIARLASLESRYREALPSKLQAPMQRISKQKYRYNGQKQGSRRAVR